MTAAPRIAFYAPMKSPHHPVPSGDREMARNLMAMMQSGGASVDLVSSFRSRDKHGDPAVQSQLFREAEDEVRRLIQTLPPFDLWVSYHNYYKAPDLIGPAVAKARAMPYVQIESTRANKRLNGPWDQFARAAHNAADAADLILSLTRRDQETLLRDRYGDQKLRLLPPFLPHRTPPAAGVLDGPILTVGMMRAGDKLASYRLIAEALTVVDGEWQLDIAGDGPALPEVETLLASFGDRVRFLGQLPQSQLSTAYHAARLFLWPGVNEAFGMVFLEAQAHGLPIVAQNRPGLREVLAPRERQAAPSIDAGAAGLASAIAALNCDQTLRRHRGAAARDHIASHHLLPAAADRFSACVAPLLKDSR